MKKYQEDKTHLYQEEDSKKIFASEDEKNLILRVLPQNPDKKDYVVTWVEVYLSRNNALYPTEIEELTDCKPPYENFFNVYRNYIN